MNKFQKALASALATGALLANTIFPVLAETTIEISGNGDSSTNTADVTFTQTTTVVQSNVADVYNNVDADAKTGDNDANYNTGGDVTIDTGDADVDVKVENTLNQNSAEVDCCPGGDTEVKISGNGSNSKNLVDLDSTSTVAVFQDNEAKVDNYVDADAKTGKNDAEHNTGGDVSITTGDAHAGVTLSTTANANSASVGGSGGGDGGTVSAWILGNGDSSTNTIDLDLISGILLGQTNYADVYNNVDADAKTGKNDANYNTGGEVSIDTGEADVDVTVDNMVNFNWASADCGCLLSDLLAKIAGNGDSTNTILAKLDSGLVVDQRNCVDERGKPIEDCALDNYVDADAKTGKNDAEHNTGGVGDDPSVETGDAEVDVDVDNSGNSNVYGATPEWDFPEWDFNFNFSFDLSDLLDWLSGQV